MQRIIVALAFGWLLFMGLSVMGVGHFADPSTVSITASYSDGSTEYTYVSDKTGEICGKLQDFKDMRVFAYAFPTQWWNFTNFDVRGGTVEHAHELMEKFCPVSK